VADRHFLDIVEVWPGMSLTVNDRIATAGSCFAQHIGRHLRQRGANYLDLEPAPDFLDEDEQKRYGYGLFSCRYGNVYTARQLLQLIDEALGNRENHDCVWPRDGRYFDALRPSVDPGGHISIDTVLELRQRHLSAVRDMLDQVDVLVFTLGLTEGWVSRRDQTVYPTAPGTLAGVFDRDSIQFVNFNYLDVRRDLEAIMERLRAINGQVRLLLTVSPVPLKATATGNHVLVATTYSKSVLRAVAGDMAESEANVHYFPSFELINAPSGRGMFFEPDLREVNEAGVSYVMSHFFRGLDGFSSGGSAEAAPERNDTICDEEAMLEGLD